ncbi:hypothetical protein RD792_005851, partial [Penstemon davidsonii]
WREETHTFHLRIGEATITLQDVGVILGIPIEGDVVTSSEPQRTKEEWLDLCLELFGVRLASDAIVGVSLKLKSLMDALPELDNNATLEMVQQQARELILGLIGDVLLPNKSGNRVDMKYLPLLRDINRIGTFSWGSAALACLYQELCRATKPETVQIGGCLTLLQIWVWERFHCMRPNIEHNLRFLPMIDPPGPLGYKWRATKLLRNIPTHVLRVYRDQLDQLTEDQFVWQPYHLEELPAICLQGQHRWMSKVPLICFEKVEWHFPDRVLRQFGMLQGIPDPCDTIRDLHTIDRRGKRHVDWARWHEQYINLWINYQNFVVNGDFGVEHMDYNHPYMIWYRSITRMIIGNSYPIPNHRDERADTGYRGIGAGVESLIARSALTALGEQERLAGQAPPAPLYDVTLPQRKQRIRNRRRVESSDTAPPSTLEDHVVNVHPPAPSSSVASPPTTQREYNPPSWYTHIECSTPNQVECVTQVERPNDPVPNHERMCTQVFTRRNTQRKRRAPNRYTPSQ